MSRCMNSATGSWRDRVPQLDVFAVGGDHCNLQKQQRRADTLPWR